MIPVPFTLPALRCTVCHRCGGRGTLLTPRAARDRDGRARSGFDPRTCPQCIGSGWLQGITAPV